MNELFGSDDDSEEDIKIGLDEVILYTEVLNMPNVGGNRGVFSVRDLPAGCLLCAEKPFITWSPGIDFTEVDDLANVVLQVARSLPALECSYTLHPKTVDECDPQEIIEIRKLFDTYDNGDLYKLAIEAKLNEEEIIRIALVLQHNGFNSGLYEKQSLFNHACVPNCIKLIPPGRHSASEIWTIREIKSGEELTICYMSPLESAHSNMRQYVETNHRFVCTCTKCLQFKQDANAYKAKQEQGDVEYEMKITEIENRTLELSQSKKKHKYVEERMKHLIQAKQLLSEDYLQKIIDVLLLTRACKAVISTIHCCFQVSDTADTLANTDLAVAFLQFNLMLLSYQKQYLEGSHPDIGSTMGDIAEGIAALREHFPKALAVNFTPVHWKTVMTPISLIQDKASLSTIDTNDVQQSASTEDSTPPLTEVVLKVATVTAATATVATAAAATVVVASAAVAAPVALITATTTTAAVAVAAASIKVCGAVSPSSTTTTTTTAPVTAAQCARYCTIEARRIKSLYTTAVKYPAAMKLLTAPPGAFYWGGEVPTPNINL